MRAIVSVRCIPAALMMHLLQDFAALVNEIGETARSRCMVCNKGVGIIKCKGCSIAAHPQCVELTSRQQQVCLHFTSITSFLTMLLSAHHGVTALAA